MRLGYAIYVTKEGVRDRETATETARSLGRAFAKRYEAGLLRGSEVIPVVDEETYAEEEIDREWVEEEIGPPPFVYATVSWDADDPERGSAEHQDIVTAFRLHRLLEAEQPPR